MMCVRLLMVSGRHKVRAASVMRIAIATRADHTSWTKLHLSAGMVWVHASKIHNLKDEYMHMQVITSRT